MANITITFADGQTHTYQNVPDNVTPDQIEQRAAQDFSNRKVQHLDRQIGIQSTPQVSDAELLRKQIESEPVWKQKLLAAGSGLVKTALGAKQLFSPLTPEQQDAVKAATAAEEISPFTAAAGNIATMVAPGLGAAGLAAKAPMLARALPSTTRAAEAVGGSLMAPKTLGQAAAGGAGYMALQPNIGAEADIGTRAIEATKGAALGGVGYGAAKGLSTLLNPKLYQTVSPTGGRVGVNLGETITPKTATSAELERLSTLARLPVPITEKDVIRSQITRQYPQQESERLIAGQPFIGAELASRLERGQEKMTLNIDELRKKLGGKAPTKEEAGETVRTWMQNIYGAAKEDTNAAYQYARQLHGDKQFYPESDIVETLTSNRAMPGYRELFSQAKNMGLIVPKKGGGFTAGRVTVNDLDKFKTMANQVAQSSDGTTRYAGGDIVNKVYSQLDNVAPEFKEAASMRKRQGMMFESPKVTQKILGTVEGRLGTPEQQLGGVTIPNYKVASEKLVDSIASGSVEDLRYVRQLVTKGTNQQREQGMAAIKEMRGSVLDGMKDVWTSTQTPLSKANQLNKYFDRLGNDKIEILFGKAGANQISNFRKAADIMNKAVPSPEGGSQTAGRLLNIGNSMMSILERLPIVGTTGAKAIRVVGNIGTAAGAKNIPSEKIPFLARRPDVVRRAGTRLSDLAPYAAPLAVGYGQ